MGVDDGPDPLALGLLQTLRCEAEPGGDLPLAANPLSELVVGFHSPRLTISSLAVQQTGRLMACSWSDATRTPMMATAPRCRRARWTCQPSQRVRRRTSRRSERSEN